MSSTNKKMPRGRLIFICVWLAVFAVSYILWALYLGYLNRSLIKYEEYAPHNTAEKVFAVYFRTADTDILLSYGGSELSQIEGAEEYLSLHLNGKTLEYREEGSDENVMRYVVYAGDTDIAEFTLVIDPDSNEVFGRRDWMLGGIGLLLFPAG